MLLWKPSYDLKIILEILFSVFAISKTLFYLTKIEYNRSKLEHFKIHVSISNPRLIQ